MEIVILKWSLIRYYFEHKGLHSASVPGILAIDIHDADTSKILTGGADKNATVFNKDTEQVVAILKGHTKKVTKIEANFKRQIETNFSMHLPERMETLNFWWYFIRTRTFEQVTRVIYYPDEDIVMTASPDTTIRIWNVETSQTTLLFTAHDAPVTGLSLHPTGDYLLFFGSSLGLFSEYPNWEIAYQGERRRKSESR